MQSCSHRIIQVERGLWRSLVHPLLRAGLTSNLDPTAQHLFHSNSQNLQQRKLHQTGTTRTNTQTTCPLALLLLLSIFFNSSQQELLLLQPVPAASSVTVHPWEGSNTSTSITIPLQWWQSAVSSPHTQSLLSSRLNKPVPHFPGFCAPASKHLRGPPLDLLQLASISLAASKLDMLQNGPIPDGICKEGLKWKVPNNQLLSSEILQIFHCQWSKPKLTSPTQQKLRN